MRMRMTPQPVAPAHSVPPSLCPSLSLCGSRVARWHFDSAQGNGWQRQHWHAASWESAECREEREERAVSDRGRGMGRGESCCIGRWNYKVSLDLLRATCRRLQPPPIANSVAKAAFFSCRPLKLAFFSVCKCIQSDILLSININTLFVKLKTNT